MIPVNPSLSALLNAIDVPRLLTEKRGPTQQQLALQPNVRTEITKLLSIDRVGEDTFKKYLKIQILYTQTYIHSC